MRSIRKKGATGGEGRGKQTKTSIQYLNDFCRILFKGILPAFKQFPFYEF